MLRVTHVHSDIRGLPLLIDHIHARANWFQSAKAKLFSPMGMMIAIACVFVLLGGFGCSTYEFGTNGPLQEANPQHEEELAFNPLTGEVKVRHRSNDKHSIVIGEATFARDGDGLKTVTLKNLTTSSDSESIRLANVQQKEATYKGLTMLSDSFWKGLDQTLTNAINAAMPGIEKYIDAHPQADKATIDSVFWGMFQKALSDQLIGAK